MSFNTDQSPSAATPSGAVTSIVTSTTESNPFMQIPTPIQRPGFGRQSFYLRESQQGSTYDEGDGIVPSTPTLFVPRRGDSFADALNSPRVPQSRFVFSSAIQENTPLSQLASETTLGVDDTRMDLSQFDDNNGRSVPTTPLANSPANVHSTGQNIEGDNDSDQNFGVDPTVTETIVPIEFESDRIEVETTNVDNNRTEIEFTETVGQSVDTQSRPTEETEPRGEEVLQSDIESVATSTSSNISIGRGLPTARRGRSFGPQRGTLQRRPILPPTSPVTSDEPNAQNRIAAQSSAPQPSTQNPQQSGRTIRLRDSKFSARGNFRGRPSRPPRGSRGSYHYNN